MAKQIAYNIDCMEYMATLPEQETFLPCDCSFL
jgi:hypothetical protein